MDNFIIYTDGSSRPQTTKAGGWGYVILSPDGSATLVYGHIPAPTTNNVAEVSAVLEALKFFNKHFKCTKIHFISDSQYVVQGINEWSKNWIKRGWKTNNGQPVKNVELWKELVSIWDSSRHTIEWCRGHNGTEFNEAADKGANYGSEGDSGYKILKEATNEI